MNENKPTDLFASIARRLYEVGADVGAMGPETAALLGDRLGAPLRERLLGLDAELAAMQTELAAIRPAFVQSELERNGVSPEKRGLLLHLGAGTSVLPSWINIDVFPAQLRLNLRWGLPFADESADYVFFSHVLEHLYYPDDVLGLLGEIRRVLRPGGVVRIVVPDVEKCIRAYHARDEAFFENRKKYWPWARFCTTPLEHFLEYAGANARPEMLWMCHKFGYDFETLALTLQRAGFASVTKSEYMKSEHEALRVDDHSGYAGASHEAEHYSLFVDAVR